MKKEGLRAVATNIARNLTPNAFLRKARLSQKLYYYTVLGLILGVGGGTFLWQVIHPFSSNAAWVNDNWAYRKPIAISSHTSAEQNVYINLTGAAALDTSDTTRFQADCGDLRFTTQSGDILPYYIASGCGTATTVVHVFFKSFPAGAQTIYYYYGNPNTANAFSASDFSTVATNYAIGSQGTEERAPSPSLYYKFDDGFGNVASDSALFQLHGGIFGAAWQTSDSCMSSRCLFFDGTNDNVNAGDRSQLEFSNGKDFTLSLWVRSPLSGTSTLIAKKAATTAGNSGYMLNLSSGGVLTFYAADGTDQYQLDTGSIISANTWYQVTVVYDDDSTTNTAIYVNGNKVTTTPTGTLANVDDVGVNSREVKVGSESDDQAYFKGFFDEIKIYSFALSSSQVKTSYKAVSSGEDGAVLGASSESYLSDGLVGYWRMDETSANGCSGGSNDSCDSSGSGNDAAWGGNATASSSAKFGAGVTFDGTGDYVDVGTPSKLTDITKRTWVAWIKPLSGGENSLGRIFDKRDYVAITPSGQIQYQMRFSTTDALYQTGVSAVSFGEWSHVAITYDTTSTENLPIIYINGVKKSASLLNGVTPVGTHSSDSGFTQYIGNAAGLARSFDGVIDEARIYNRILSPLEIEKLYNFAPGPVGHWKLDEAVGTAVIDSTGNGNGGAWTSPNWTFGKYGKAGLFDGSATKANMGNNTNLNPGLGYWSYCFWVNTTSSQQGGIVGKEPFSYNGWGVFMTTTGLLRFDAKMTNPPGTLNRMDSTFAINDGRWHHACATYDRFGDAKVYIDGVFNNKVSVQNQKDQNFNGADVFQIGSATSGYFQGKIDDVRYYNYLLSPRQIVEIMNAGHPVVGSPIGSALGYWKFDEGQGTITNNSGNQGGLLNGSISGATWRIDGKFAKSLAFDGIGSYVSMGPGSGLPVYSPGTGYSVSFWVNGPAGQTDKRVFSEGSTSSNNPLFNLGTNSSGGALDVYVRDNSNTALVNHVTSTGTVFDNTWHHVVWTDNNGTAKVYIDGKKDASNFNYTTSTLTLNRTAVGAILRASAANFFLGQIDEVKVYNYVLSSSEAEREYNRGSSLVLGSFGMSSSGVASNSASATYCVPGDTRQDCQPQAEWKFEEKQGTVAKDSSGNGADATFVGSPQWTVGKYGSALKFDGSGAYVSAQPFRLDGDKVTMSGWVNFDSPDHINQVDEYHRLFGMNSEFDLTIRTGVDAAYFIRLQGTPDNGTTNEINVFCAPSPRPRGWHHVSAVYDGSEAIIYFDARRCSAVTKVDTGIENNAQPFLIGGFPALSYYWDSSIDEVRYYRYALTPAQIAWDYNRGKPVAHYRMDECQGSTINDLSGNSLHGTVTLGASGVTTVGTCSTGSTAWGNGATGKYNSSLSFDGVSDYINIGSTSVLGTNLTTLSVSAWVKKASNNSIDAIVWHDVDSNASSFRVDTLANGDLEYNVGDFSTGFTCTGSNISDTNWHHIVMTFNGSTLQGYIDGKQDCSDGSGSYTAANATTWIGAGDVGSQNYWMDGQIDEVQIFNYPLTSYQVKLLYNQSSGIRFGPSTGTP